MANEFIIKNGFHSKGDSEITGSLEVSGSNTNFILNSTDSKFTDSRTTTKGIEYSADYSSNFTSRSLVDRNYVDTNITTNITASVGAGLTYNTTTNKIDLGGVLNFNDPNNAANNIYFTPTLGANLVTWGLNSDNDVATNSAQNQVHYITYFRNWSSLGTFNVTGYYGEGAYGNGVSGNSLGCYEHQGNTFHIKEYKDVSQFSNSDGSINSYGGTSSKRTFSQYDDNNSHILQIWESDSTVGTPRNSKFTNTFSKFEWLIDNTAGHTSTFRFTEGGINISIPNADNSKSLTAILQPNAIYLKDGEGLGITTFPTGLLLGDMGAFKGLFIGKGVNDSYYDDNTTNKKGIKYVGFGETNADTAAGANYNTLVGTSLVPKKYLEDYVAASGSADTIYTADDTIGTGRVATLTDTLNFSEGTFNLLGLDKDKKVSYVSGDSLFGGPSTYVNNALNFKYDSNTGTGQLWTINSGGGNGKINIKGSEVFIENIKTNDNLIVSGNSNAANTERSIEMPFGTSGMWKGVNMLSTQKSGGGADFEMQVSPGGLGGTYETALKIAKNKDVTITKKLELSTTTDGFLMPRLTTAQMNAISSPDTHLLIFNTDLNALYRYNGSAWVAMAAGYGIIEVKDSSGNPTFYTDLQTAINATSTIGTVTIHSNIQLTTTVNIPGRTSLTINFQGNRIYGDTSGGDFNLFTITQSNGGNRRDLQFIGGGVLETIGTVTAVGSAMPFSALNPGSDIFRLYAGETQIRSINGNCFYTNGMNLIKGGIFYSENAGASFGGTIEDISLDVYNRPTLGSIVRYCKLITRFGGFFVSQNAKIHNCFIKGPVTSTGNYGLLYIHRGTECYDNYLEQTDTSASGRDALYIRGSSPNSTGIDGRVSGNTCINRGVGSAGNLVYGSVYDNYFFSESGWGLYVGGNCKIVTNNKCFTNAASGKQAINSGAEETIKNYAENVNSSNAEPALTINSASGQTHEAHGNTAIVANNSASNIKLFGPGVLYISNNIMGLLGTGLDLNGNTNSQINTTDEFGNIKIG